LADIAAVTEPRFTPSTGLVEPVEPDRKFAGGNQASLHGPENDDMHHDFPPSGVCVSDSGGGESQRITAAVQAMTLDLRLATALI